MSFDARTAKLLQPGSHITIDDCPGLRFKVTSSARFWLYRYKSRIDGRMRQMKLGGWPAMSAAAATVEWERLRKALDEGRDPAMEKRTARSTARVAVEAGRLAKREATFTVAKVCNDYWGGHVAVHRQDKGSNEIRRMFDTMLGDFADRPATQLTRVEAFEFLEGFKHIPVQASKLRAELAAAWDYSLDAGRLPESTPNWWRRIMRGRFRSKGKKLEGVSIGTTKRVLSEAELCELVPWLPNFSRSVQDVLTLYLWTRARGAEIVSMAASEISEETDGLWWTLPKAKTKNARHEKATDLRVPLVGRAATIVRRRLALADGGYLFKSNGRFGHIEQKAIQGTVYIHQPYSKTRPEYVRPRLTVTRWAPHDLRRTARTILASIGCPDAVADAMLGHMQPGVKGIYNLHAYDKEKREWAVRLDAYFEKLLASG